MTALADLTRYPIIQAPMAGGASTPALAAAVADAGGLGFLAGGYKTAAALRDDITETRRRTNGPFGVNLFVPSTDDVDEAGLDRYRSRLAVEARERGTALGEPVWDDDGWPSKLELLLTDPVPMVSVAFGCPDPDVIAALRDRGSVVAVSVTTPEEAEIAAAAGADAVIAQGAEAGGHRASFSLSDGPDYGLLALIALVRARVELPVIAAGGLMSGRSVAAVLTAGAAAAQLGTAFLRCPESGAHPVHKAALADSRFSATAITRAFSGRRARGLVNRFMREHSTEAPAAYPHVNHMVSPLRKAAAEQGDPDGMAMWAGQAYRLAEERPAAEIVARLAEQ